MAGRKLFGRLGSDGDGPDRAPRDMPLGGTHAEAIQRLQIGLFGIGAMVLLVGLASIIGGQADLTQQSSVPDAAPTTEPTAAPAQSDPLADAGVVPDIPTDPTPAPTSSATAAPQASPALPLPADVDRPR